jgi:thiamine-monophosphate kinase
LSSPANEIPTLVADAGERAIIELIRARIPAAPPEVVVGIGDDAAVVRPDRGALDVFTTDALVEGVHFDRRFSSPADIGYKAIAVNVSDVAAMGATPRVALLSLMLPDLLAVEAIDALVVGLLEMAAAARVTLVGGNITRSPGPLVVDVTVAGSVRPRRILRRSAGRPGDTLYVSGTIGGAAAGLAWLRADDGRSDDPAEPAMNECVRRYRRPEPRTRLGALLGRTRTAAACIDLSDGLADGISQVAAESGTGAAIDADALPIHPGARDWFSRSGDPVIPSLEGGEDYELLFSVPKRAKGRLRGVIREARGLPVTRIGELTTEPAVRLVRGGREEPLPRGFVHF